MVVTCFASDPAAIAGDCLVLFSPSYNRLADKTLKQLDDGTRSALGTLLASEEFSGKEKQTTVLLQPDGFAATRVVLAGLGEKSKIDADTYRRAAGGLSRHASVTSSERVTFWFDAGTEPSCFQATIEGFLLGGYKHLEFKTGAGAEDKVRVRELGFAVSDKRIIKKLEKAVGRGEIIGEGQTLVRQLANTPANHLTPRKYAKRAQSLASKYGFECTVLDEAAIRKEKMGALLSVSQGSVEPPRFLVLKHKGGRDKQKPVVLVGKGVTFDAGGISLKPSLNMHEMKGDMAGSAVVLATIATAARLNLPQNIVGLIPMAENLPSGTATKPGDVVVSRKGLTIEVINTDAEGRLLLADGLDYANTFDPQVVIDVATLTGATLYILGYSGAPIMGNSTKLLDRLQEASDATAERTWPLPIWDDMREQMKSPVADLTNSGGRPAGTIAAAAFLENFVGKWPWAHVDIAYVDVEPAGRPYVPKGTTGFGLRLLIEVLSNWKRL